MEDKELPAAYNGARDLHYLLLNLLGPCGAALNHEVEYSRLSSRALLSNSSSSFPPNLPLQVLDANFFPNFLIVIEPFSFLQINAFEDRRRLQAFRLPFSLYDISVAPTHSNLQCSYIGFEFCELKAAAIELYDVLSCWGRGMMVGNRRSIYCSGRFSLEQSLAFIRSTDGHEAPDLAVLTFPHKIGFAFTSRYFVGFLRLLAKIYHHGRIVRTH